MGKMIRLLVVLIAARLAESEVLCPEPVHLRNPADCGKFFRCYDGSIKSMGCPQGTLFDGGSCRPADEVDCVPDGSANEPNKEICPKPDAKVPNPDDCATYYQCVLGNPVLMKCADYLLWNKETEKCDWPDEVDCCENREE